MPWYEGIENDRIILASGAELLRNLKRAGFSDRTDVKSAAGLIAAVGGCLSSNGFTEVNFADITPSAAESYVEKRFIAPDFTKISTPHALYVNEPCNLAVALGGKDRISIRCITSAATPATAFGSVCKVDELIDSAAEPAFSEKYGYFTQDIANLGTGMHAFEIAFLPALAASGQIERLHAYLAEHGVILRPLFGGHGNFFEISNRETLGVGEGDILSLVGNISDQLKAAEKAERKTADGKNHDAIADKCGRSVGIIKYAHSLSASELLDLISDILLGIQLKISDWQEFPGLVSLIFEGLPANLSLKVVEPFKTQSDEDVFRAEYVRSVLS